MAFVSTTSVAVADDYGVESLGCFVRMLSAALNCDHCLCSFVADQKLSD